MAQESSPSGDQRHLEYRPSTRLMTGVDPIVFARSLDRFRDDRVRLWDREAGLKTARYRDEVAAGRDVTEIRIEAKLVAADLHALGEAYLELHLTGHAAALFREARTLGRAFELNLDRNEPAINLALRTTPEELGDDAKIARKESRFNDAANLEGQRANAFFVNGNYAGVVAALEQKFKDEKSGRIPTTLTDLQVASRMGQIAHLVANHDVELAKEANKRGLVSTPDLQGLSTKDFSKGLWKAMSLDRSLSRAIPPSQNKKYSAQNLAMHEEAGDTYRSLGLLELARPHYDKAGEYAKDLDDGSEKRIELRGKVADIVVAITTGSTRAGKLLTDIKELSSKEDLTANDIDRIAEMSTERAAHLLQIGKFDDASEALAYANDLKGITAATATPEQLETLIQQAARLDYIASMVSRHQDAISTSMESFLPGR